MVSSKFRAAQIGFLILASLGAAPLASGQPQPKAEADQFYEFFNGVCLLNMPRLDKVRAFARMRDWKPIKGDAALLLAPANPGAAFEGWSAVENGRVLIVGISEGKLDHLRKIAVCSVASTKVETAQLATAIQSALKVPISNDMVEHGQRYRTWVGALYGDQIIVDLLTPADQPAGATLSVIMQMP
jgi:hypothetical protein